MNTYGYVRGNPVKFTDRFGLIEDLFPGDDENPFGDEDPFDAVNLPPILGPFGPHCGTGSGATWIPDGNAQRVQACKNHDKCYGTCAHGDPLHKMKCDIEFLDANVGLIYFGAVNSTEAAQKAYDQAQEEACKKSKCGGEQ